MRLEGGLVDVLLVEEERARVLGILHRDVQLATRLLARRLGELAHRRGRFVLVAFLGEHLDDQHEAHASLLTELVIEPSPSISIVISSPSCSHTGGLRNAPTPAGVPVMIRSPGSSVIACEMNETTSATPKIWFDVFESCIVSPFRIARIGSACGSGTSLAGTRSPTGRKVSRDLPRTHWPSENWMSRPETSLATT